MRKLVVLSFISLDGVMQAPGGPEEDVDGGFEYGGWTVPFANEEGGAEMTKQMTPPFDLLLGRKTFDIWRPYWPKQTGYVADVFKQATKYVVSHGPVEMDWETTVRLGDDAPAEIQKLKETEGPMLQVHGSADLIQTLLKHDLVDELWVKTYPVTLGKGKRLFGEGTIPARFSLTYSKVSPTGVIFANYERNGDVETGSFT
jgi:dihydrofolate reductase